MVQILVGTTGMGLNALIHMWFQFIKHESEWSAIWRHRWVVMVEHLGSIKQHWSKRNFTIFDWKIEEA
nr:probable leucine-rich repeat receptor-like protein kinase At5g49770 isoform X4 [Ipomoea batatas]